MADVKISGLPASTVPLAGTEVLPVVQGGATKKVAVSDLTAGRAVSALSLTSTSLTATRVPFAGTGGLLTDSAALTFDGSYLYLKAADPRVVLQPSTTTNFACFQAVNAGGTALMGLDSSGAGLTAPYALNIFHFGAYPITFSTSATERMRIFAGGGVSIGNTTDPGAGALRISDNLVIGTSGKGIDFSATAGTGTSELLADYEEGTWTPIYTTDGTNFTSVSYDVQSATYTKIGRVVTVTFTIATGGITIGAATGNVMIGGLPFTTGSTGRTGVGFLRGQSSNYPFLVNAPSFTGSESGTTKFYLFVGTNQYLAVTDMKLIGTGNLVAGTLTYIST